MSDSEEHLKPPKIRRRHNVTLELLNMISLFYRGVSGSFLPAWKSQERKSLSILPPQHSGRLNWIHEARLLSLKDRIKNQCPIQTCRCSQNPGSSTYLIAILENTGGKECSKDISHRCTGTPESKDKTSPAEGKEDLKQTMEGQMTLRTRQKRNIQVNFNLWIKLHHFPFHFKGAQSSLKTKHITTWKCQIDKPETLKHLC